ncbi:MAG: hypothetical protein RET84_02545 [Pseudomonadota bacterium]|nr:hypothetical protein [Pseudomonadota bacterium]
MHLLEDSNPFAPIRATDYTDEQINDLWVEMGAGWLSTILEARSVVSKYILGSKGSGKTHLLRYQSYPVARLRMPSKSGLTLVEENGCLAVFLRATNIDAGRFKISGMTEQAMQQLFSVHLELKVLELVLAALKDIRQTTPTAQFEDGAFLEILGAQITDPQFAGLQSLIDLSAWVSSWLRAIDDATNAAAFNGEFNLKLPFVVGRLMLPLGVAFRRWNAALNTTNLICIIDEIENLSIKQHEVINTFVRFAEGRISFRLTGRLYARKTLATMDGGEENREGSEFSVVRLDESLLRIRNYSEFASRFISKRMGFAHPRLGPRTPLSNFDPRSAFEEVDVEEYARQNEIPISEARFAKLLHKAVERAKIPVRYDDLIKTLALGVPPLLQRLNVLLFCKKLKKGANATVVSERIRGDCDAFMQHTEIRSTYATALGHWKGDVFAQLCRESKRRDGMVPYAGFSTLVTMSSHNPRNLLVLLGKVYELAAFIDGDVGRSRLSVDVQTSAVIDAARFCFEGDSNYGFRSDQAREAVNRLAELLRTARYSLNIPEVAPLAVSFDASDLDVEEREVLESALNYSLVIEISDGRPDRNTQRLNRKIQLSPMIAPRWGLPVGRRGDLSLDAPLLKAIFSPKSRDEFDVLVAQQSTRWNFPFSSASALASSQKKLF